MLDTPHSPFSDAIRAARPIDSILDVPNDSEHFIIKSNSNPIRISKNLWLFLSLRKFSPVTWVVNLAERKSRNSLLRADA